MEDIAVACEAIIGYASRDSAPEDLVFDAVRIRPVEIGETVKGLTDGLKTCEPELPWKNDIARMRDSLAHHYFDTSHAIVTETARSDVPTSHAAVLRLLDR